MAIEDFKLERFREEHPGNQFPTFDHVTEAVRKRLKEELAAKLGLPPDVDSLELLKRLHAAFELPTIYNATDPRFNLKAVIEDFKANVEGDVYINWDRFDNVDKIRFDDLAAYFSYIWYAVSDDIEIFDDSLQWIIVIRHDRAVACVPMISA
jgi:hypothetical protein